MKIFLFRPCGTDTYFRNIISSNISEILYACITVYFNFLFSSLVINCGKKKILKDRMKAKIFIWYNCRKCYWRIRSSIFILLCSMCCFYGNQWKIKVEKENLNTIMVAGTEQKRAYNGILNELRLTHRENFQRFYEAILNIYSFLQ